MKNIFLLTVGLLCLNTAAFSQMGERRNKVEMTVQQSGKPITVELNSVSTSISRYIEQYEAPTQKTNTKDSVKTQTVTENKGSDSFYMSIEAQKVDSDFLRILADKSKRFSGKITVTDLFGKNPIKTLEFKDATLYSYSDPTYYSDNYGYPPLSILCKSITINGVEFKQ